MVEDDKVFMHMVDELVAFSEHDPELADGIKWLDHESRRRNVSFYEMVFHVLNREDNDNKAKKWMRSRQ